jgi:hypothetical protein
VSTIRKAVSSMTGTTKTRSLTTQASLQPLGTLANEIETLMPTEIEGKPFADAQQSVEEAVSQIINIGHFTEQEMLEETVRQLKDDYLPLDMIPNNRQAQVVTALVKNLDEESKALLP